MNKLGYAVLAACVFFILFLIYGYITSVQLDQKTAVINEAIKTGNYRNMCELYPDDCTGSLARFLR